MFDHGLVIDKETGEFGIITTYLPDMETFAVSFKKEHGWWTFKMTEEDFNRKFHVALHGHGRVKENERTRISTEKFNLKSKSGKPSLWNIYA